MKDEVANILENDDICYRESEDAETEYKRKLAKF